MAQFNGESNSLGEVLIRPDELGTIEQLAERLTENEVCLYIWGLPLSSLGSPDSQASVDFNKAYIRGRTRMKIYAVNALKQACHGRSGLQASLAILTRFGEAWPRLGDAETQGKDFNFKIVLNDED